jgi:hypothetical protein
MKVFLSLTKAYSWVLHKLNKNEDFIYALFQK